MGTIISTRKAMCKDCKYCIPFYEGKRKRHFCINKGTKLQLNIVRLKDLVCKNWVIKYTE